MNQPEPVAMRRTEHMISDGRKLYNYTFTIEGEDAPTSVLEADNAVGEPRDEAGTLPVQESKTQS